MRVGKDQTKCISTFLFIIFYLSSVNLKALYMPVNKFSIQRIMHFFTEIVLQVSFNKSKYKMGCKVTPLFS